MIFLWIIYVLKNKENFRLELEFMYGGGYKMKYRNVFIFN